MSGVLQGQGLVAANEKLQQPFKRLANVNINPNDNSRLLQQLIVQQQKLQEGKKTLHINYYYYYYCYYYVDFEQ